MNSKNTIMEDRTEPLAYEAPEIRELLAGLAYGELETKDGIIASKAKDAWYMRADGEGEENDTFDLDY